MEEEFLFSGIFEPFEEPIAVPDVPSPSNKKFIDIFA